ncbi:MAG TPA: hypothetical protein VJI33_02840 [Candidatus Paceibacterota bacterium]
MNKNKITVLFFAAAFIFLIVLFTGGLKRNNDKLPSQQNNATSTVNNGQVGVSYTGSGNIKIEQIPISGGVPTPPNLERPLNFPVDMTQEVRVIMGKRIADNITKLKSNSLLPNEWLALGTNRKIIADYEGAREAWEYVVKLSPKYPTAFANLSDLYGYYLKDNVKAEANYLKAIENDPTFPNYYIRASDFYREIVNDLSKAKAILIRGLATIPDDPNLKIALEQVNLLISN